MVRRSLRWGREPKASARSDGRGGWAYSRQNRRARAVVPAVRRCLPWPGWNYSTVQARSARLSGAMRYASTDTGRAGGPALSGNSGGLMAIDDFHTPIFMNGDYVVLQCRGRGHDDHMI